MARIIQAPAARADAVEIWAYIAQDNPVAADTLLARLDRAFHKLSQQPFIGKSVEEMAPDLRFFPLGSYLIFYRALKDDQGVEIVRILHGARDITAEFFRG